MSSYYNRFKDGPNEKPKKKKPSRTGHPKWSDILKTKGQIRKKALDKAIKKAGG